MRSGHVQSGTESNAARHGWNGVSSRALTFLELGHLNAKSAEYTGSISQRNKGSLLPGLFITSGKYACLLLLLPEEQRDLLFDMGGEHPFLGVGRL